MSTDRVRLTLCRGCCCGTLRKRPDVDHDAQRERIEELSLAVLVTSRVSDCLGPCEDANVIVVQPKPSARADGARPVWRGHLGARELDLVIAWVTAGGPGHKPLPAGLAPHVIPR